jgi:undecaprenyl phosphate N,N'-diacetylbacillosamine 1-phosphate transferase
MYSKIFKRIIDIIFVVIISPFFCLLFVPITILIMLEDGGPVFYNAKRIGKNGIPFIMYKFRTMYVNSPDLRRSDRSTVISKDDPRVTKVGRILREASLDELPQLLNLLMGDMSLIGPRPDLEINKEYPEKHFYNLRIKPGITGYTQAYYRNQTTWSQKLEYDKYYVDHLSFYLDLKILLRTIIIVFSKKKVYRE